MDSTDDTSPISAESTTPRWFQRVLPVLAIGVAVVALAALLVPAVRDELALSTSRQPERYVALYFPRSATTGAPVTCVHRGGKVRVRFAVASHLERRAAVAYRVTVNPYEKGLRLRSRTGATPVSPSTTVLTRERLALPRGRGYTVSVSLPAFDQRLRAHCRGRSS